MAGWPSEAGHTARAAGGLHCSGDNAAGPDANIASPRPVLGGRKAIREPPLQPVSFRTANNAPGANGCTSMVLMLLWFSESRDKGRRLSRGSVYCTCRWRVRVSHSPNTVLVDVDVL